MQAVLLSANMVTSKHSIFVDWAFEQYIKDTLEGSVFG